MKKIMTHLALILAMTNAVMFSQSGATQSFSGESKALIHIDCWGNDLKNTGSKNRLSITLIGEKGQITDYYTFGDRERRLGSGNQIPLSDVWGTSYFRTSEIITDGDCEPGVFEKFAVEIEMSQDGEDYTPPLVGKCGGNPCAMYEGRLQSIQIRTDGDDAFWLDQLEVEITSNKTAWPDFRTINWGVDQGKGYCLSTDRTDADRTWKKSIGSGGCSPCWEFLATGGDVRTCKIYP